MKSIEYDIILLLPPLFVGYGTPLLVLLLMRLCSRTRLDRISSWVATTAFSDIVKMKKEKTCCRTGMQWLFKEIDLTTKETLLSKVLTRLLILFITMLSVVLILFWRLLVLDLSYDCEADDLTKDCFEDKWSWESQDPLNCSSAAVRDLIRNGTIQVMCYKIVLNFGLATGVGYGSFKLSLIVINVGTSLMLMIKKTKTLRCVQGIGVFLFVGLMTSFVVVASVIPSVDHFLMDNAVVAGQITALAVPFMVFLCIIPWKEIMEEEKEKEKEKEKRAETKI